MSIMPAFRHPSASEELYESDLHEWSLRMAEALRNRDAGALDWEHVAEEIEGLASRDRKELFSRTRVLLVNLLKWKMQPEHRSNSWRNTIRNQRYEISLLLEQSPSLRRFIPQAVERGYPNAVESAVSEMGLLKNPFPKHCPFSIEQLIDSGYLPE